MKVRFLDNCVADKKAHYKGEVAEISDKDALFLMKTKRVVKVESVEPEPIEQEEFIEVQEEVESIDDVVGQGLDSETREAEIKKAEKKKAK